MQTRVLETGHLAVIALGLDLPRRLQGEVAGKVLQLKKHQRPEDDDHKHPVRTVDMKRHCHPQPMDLPLRAATAIRRASFKRAFGKKILSHPSRDQADSAMNYLISSDSYAFNGFDVGGHPGGF